MGCDVIADFYYQQVVFAICSVRSWREIGHVVDHFGTANWTVFRAIADYEASRSWRLVFHPAFWTFAFSDSHFSNQTTSHQESLPACPSAYTLTSEDAQTDSFCRHCAVLVSSWIFEWFDQHVSADEHFCSHIRVDRVYCAVSDFRAENDFHTKYVCPRTPRATSAKSPK